MFLEKDRCSKIIVISLIVVERLYCTQGAQFEPLAVDFRPPVVRELPDNPLSIFHLLVPESLVEEWVVATNLAAESHISLPDTPKPWSRLQRWRPTCTSEIYLFMAILISMENHEETAVQDYWKSSIMDSVHPFYPWTRYMTLNRFEQLWRYIRVYNGEPIPQGSVNKAYLSIDEWSDHIQDTMATLYVPGSHVAVDECMQGFTGKSRLKNLHPQQAYPGGHQNLGLGSRWNILTLALAYPKQRPSWSLSTKQERPSYQPHTTRRSIIVEDATPRCRLPCVLG